MSTPKFAMGARVRVLHDLFNREYKVESYDIDMGLYFVRGIDGRKLFIGLQEEQLIHHQ